MQATPTARAEHLRALRQVQTKQEIIAELVSGRLPLLEATARFQQVGNPYPRVWEAPDRDDPEQWCRTVIGWAHLALSDRPERAEAVARKLEQELQTHLSRHGSLRLPA